ncbi:protein-tyrosine phosphatase-like protein [Suillus spraguei]|nr:protein-tyrosine phosphatase-like protein [Suillus spraguei]
MCPSPPPAQFRPSVLLNRPQSQPKSLIQSKVAIHQPWVTQLAQLASQYHLSEYNRIKYGHRGCPIPYAPLSLNAPDTFRDLRDRQVTNMNAALWWPCPQPSCTTTQVIPASEQRNALVTGSACPCLDPLLQKELNAALEDTLSSPQTIPEDTSHCSMPVKTSITHPLNISSIVPPELLPAISSHLTANPEPSPVIFHIPDFYTLYRITDYAQHIPSTTSTTSLAISRKAHSRWSSRIPLLPSIPAHSSSLDPIPHAPPLPIPPAFMNQPPQSIIEALQAAIDTRLTTLTKPRASFPFIAKFSPPTLKHSTKGRVIPDDLASNRSSPPQRETSALPKVVFPSMLDFLNSSEREQLAFSVASQNSTKTRASGALLCPTSNIHGTTRCFKLGNLMLSSCPGKKVRLAGPVRGRSAVCRDLETDLQRISQIGARCIVCCLDDEELEFLGIQWSDYVSCAHRAGMDVLRIPLPEGLAPLSPQSLDESLTKLIDGYSMRGAHILVHCRGGLGRAGLIACCWALKIGLCGWINPRQEDTLQLVERAITVVRRRRSVKAIETLEQVRFLTEYVDFLREGAGRGPS